MCNVTFEGTHDPAAVFSYASEEGPGGAAGCSRSHGECTKTCGKKFNEMLDDEQCGAWIRQYAARAPATKEDLDLFIERCDVRRTSDSSWWLLAIFISFLGVCLLTIAIRKPTASLSARACERTLSVALGLAWPGAVGYKQANKGTAAEEANAAGVSLADVAKARKLKKEASVQQIQEAKDESDDI